MRRLAAGAALFLTVQAQAQIRPQAFSLPNSLRVVLLEDHERPLVRACLHLPLDPETVARPGLAAMALRVLGQSDAAAVRIGDFEQLLAGAGIELTPALRADGLSWSLLTRSRDQDLALGLLADRAFRSVLDTATLETERLAYWRETERLEASPRAKLRAVLEPDRTLQAPSLESLTTLSFEELLAFRARVLRPDRAVLVLHGDLGLEQAKRLVYLSFGTWTVSSAPQAPPHAPTAAPAVPSSLPKATPAAPPPATPPVTPAASPQPVRINAPGALPRALAVALEPKDLDREARALLALLLPGDPALFPARIRIEGLDLVAALDGEAQASPAATEALLLERLQALRQRGFTEADLRQAKAAWSAGRALAGLHPEALVGEALDEARGRRTSPARMQALTVEGLNGALRRWLDPAQLKAGALGASRP